MGILITQRERPFTYSVDAPKPFSSNVGKANSPISIEAVTKFAFRPHINLPFCRIHVARASRGLVEVIGTGGGYLLRFAT
jgi:hypothetical protein